MIEHLGFLVDRQPSKILHVFTVTGEPLLHITMVSGPDPVVSETQPVEPLAMSGFPLSFNHIINEAPISRKDSTY
jgi:hypothetical protein